MSIDIKAIRARCEVATGWSKIKETHVFLPFAWDFIAHARQDLPDCLNEIERLRTLLQTVATKHNLLKGLVGYPACKCKGSELCMKHAAADILDMINEELETE